MSISTTIDNLIQRTNNAKICQDYFKLITSNLTRLRQGLSDTEPTINDNQLSQNMSNILKAIDELVTSCTTNETDLNGMTYRDLESLLLRLHWRLAQYEANTIDDHEAKKQLLTNTYQEQQLLTQTSSDETMKQKLDATEQHTNENTTQQHRFLREKYTKTIESYLRRSIHLHKSVSIIGITNTTAVKTAHTYYPISLEDQNKLEHNWKTFELPLDRTFIQLKNDKLTSFERNEATHLLLNSKDNLSQNSYEEKLLSAPYMMSMIERDQKSEKDDVTEENIIRTKRRITILGDPGSGKTSFARRITHHLAQTLLLNEQHSTKYGPLRIPILIQIEEFTEMLKTQPSLTLFDYIGKHEWMGSAIVDDSSISLDDLSCALQDYIKQGQALIILGGLDKISVSNQRSKIIDIVEKFIESYVQSPLDASVLDNSHLSKLFDDPSKTGGNQLIITNRIVGYYDEPLAGQFSHYAIQPMDMEHVKQFINYWFSHLHQQILDILNLSVANQGEKQSEVLIKELEKTENVGFQDIASNSFLLSFMCSMVLKQVQDSPLFTQRIYLIGQIVDAILSLWSTKRSTIPMPKLIRCLSGIAYHIQKYSPSNVIDEKDIVQACIISNKAFIDETILTATDIQNVERQASEYARIICTDVGILTARGETQYSFQHLIFQEYFTCLKLIDDGLDQESDIQVIAQPLRQHLNDPRFKTCISLALGKISASWPQEDFDKFCHAFIQEEDESDNLIPLGAYALISCTNDLVHYPSDEIVFDALDRLIIAAVHHKWSIVSPFLFHKMAAGLGKFRNDIVSLWINKFLSQSSSYDIETISVFCHFIEGESHEFENIKWLNQSSCSMLQSLSKLDTINNEFAIDRLLIKVAFSNHQLLPINPSTLKEFLLTDEIQMNSIPVFLLPLIISLYGGLKRDGQTVIFDPSYIHRESSTITPMLIRFLSIKDRSKQDQGLKKLKQECIKSFLARTQQHEESSETVDLCIATICLYDIEYIQDNMTIISDTLLQMTMDRLKYVSMILRQFYFTSDENDRSVENETTKFISIAVEKFQYGESARVQFLDLLDALKGDMAGLRSSTTSTLLEGESKPRQRVTLYLPNNLRKEDKLLNGLLTADIRLLSDRSSCSLLHHFMKLFWILENNDEFNSQYRMAVGLDTIPTYLAFRNDEDPLCCLTFIPEHLRNLYLRLLMKKYIMINLKDHQSNGKQHLYFSHILIECLISLSNASCKRLSIMAALITLLSWLRTHYLESFGASLLWALSAKHSDNLGIFETKRQCAINFETGQYTDTDENIFEGHDIHDGQRKQLIENDVKQEHERLRNARTRSDGRNMELYSASVSLAHVCRWSEDERRLRLLNESVQGAMTITNKLARLDALCVIAFYSHSDYHRVQVNTGRSLQQEIENQFNDIYPTLPLLLHTAIFIRCLPLLRNQSMIDLTLRNLFDKFGDNDRRDQQAVNEALLPYLQSNLVFSSLTKDGLDSLSNGNKLMHNKSSVMKKYFNISTDESLSMSVLISNLYLVELGKDFHECLKTDVRQFSMNELVVTKLFQLESYILTEAQVMVITNIVSSAFTTGRSDESVKLCGTLSRALRRVSLVEFKACHLLESWLKWKDFDEFFSFAYHAALLLIKSDLWSVDAITIVCDLLRNDDDHFRRRSEMIFRSASDNDVQTSSKLGIDVLLTLVQKKAYYQVTSASAKLTLGRMIGNIILDIQSHLEIFLWLERYRIHALANKGYSLKKSRSWANSYINSYFSNDTLLEASVCVNLFKISGDLIIYMCDMLSCNLFSFLEIDGDSTSDAVSESHNQFVVSVLVTLNSLLNNNDYLRQMAVEALMNLFDMSINNEIRRAVAYALGYVCNASYYKSLFEKIQMLAINDNSETSNQVLASLISSYSYCICINKIAFDPDDIDLFSGLLNHSSQDVVKATRTGYGRVLKDNSFLLEMLGSDTIQCYQALSESTAYLFLQDVQRNSENAITEFIEEHSALLSIFIVELYNSIQHFTNSVLPQINPNYDLAYGYPQYVRIASLVAVRMPTTFCSLINDWNDGDKFKRALYYTSKQHNYPQRAACLNILSLFGELTVDLCEMFIEALYDDPYIQNTCYKCLTRIKSIKDETVVLNLLFSYLKSKSMNIRYVAVKILLQLSQSSAISFKQVRTVLNELMLDPRSNEDLLLIEEQDNIFANCVYYCAGPLKDVVYSLLIQYLTGSTSENVHRNVLNDIDRNFIEFEEVSRIASCLYEPKSQANEETERSSTQNHLVNSDGGSVATDLSLSEHDFD